MTAPRALRVLLGMIVTLGGLLLSPRAKAHEVRPAVLTLLETSPGRFDVRWYPPKTSDGETVEVAPTFPSGCTLSKDHHVLDCGSQGLDGEIRFPELTDTLYRVALNIAWSGGAHTSRTVDGHAPSVEVRGTPREAGLRALLPIARDYTLLGIEHILTGVDHLLFVTGLVLLVRWRRRLLVTITAFTAAHSVALAGAALGFTRVPAPPVEVVIALSILLLSVECLRPGDSLTRRAPWAVAFGFGLLHGFGFAGALAEVGLPPHQATFALLFFNVGVELGQLAAIGALWLGSRLVRRHEELARRIEVCVVYAMGSFAAFWVLQRAVAMLDAPPLQHFR